jgi:hypothetical protein
MRAIHWLRTRQEERELSYWLSIVSYDRRDRSYLNRTYLLYLIFFFTAWVFAMLTFLAGPGSAILRFINPSDPMQAAIFIEVLLLGVWSVFGITWALKRSPVVFSESDQTLICQTPANRRAVALRWLFMPWLKSAIPFWIFAITLGFSLAELTMASAIDIRRIAEYARYGAQTWFSIMPIHLFLFTLQWIIGICRLRHDENRHWLPWIVMPISLAGFGFLVAVAYDPTFLAQTILNQFATSIISTLQASFAPMLAWQPLLLSWFSAALALVLLALVSERFNLSRAAQETQQFDAIKSAQQYGFTEYAAQLQMQKRLGVERPSARISDIGGAGALTWKSLLQAQRSFRFSSSAAWAMMFLFLLGFAFLPDLLSRLLVIAFWTIQVAPVLVAQLRTDLSHWPLFRQLPVSGKKLVLAELAPAFALATLISLCGLFIGASILKTPAGYLAAALPGIIASVAGFSCFDVIRHAKSHLLIGGTVPGVSATGLALSVIAAAIPLAIGHSLSGLSGLILSTLASLALGALAFHLAVRAYKNIGS